MDLENLYYIGIIIVFILIFLVVKSIYKNGFDSFVSEEDKLKRANEVINKTSAQFRSDPDMSYDKFKQLMPDGNAVEYRDMRNAADNNNYSASLLANKW